MVCFSILYYQTHLNCNLLSLQFKKIFKLPNLSGIGIFHRKCIFGISITHFILYFPFFFFTLSDKLVNMNVDSAFICFCLQTFRTMFLCPLDINTRKFIVAVIVIIIVTLRNHHSVGVIYTTTKNEKRLRQSM